MEFVIILQMVNNRIKPKIEAGVTYTNGRTGKIKRKVIAIGKEYRPALYAGKKYAGNKNEWVPNTVGVLFEEEGQVKCLMHESFRHWMGAIYEKNKVYFECEDRTIWPVDSELLQKS